MSLLDTGNLQCDLNLHTSDISPCSCIHSWHQSSHQIHLSQLGLTCHLLDVPGSCLRTLHLLFMLSDLAYVKPVQIYVAIIDCLGDKLFIFSEELKDVHMKYLGCFWGVLSQSNLSLYCIVAFIK